MITNCRVIVFAKAPVAGFAKTRLIPALGARGAAALALRLLEHAMRQARLAGPAALELCCAPEAGHAAFSTWAGDAGVTLTGQGDGDLGQRMTRALERGLQQQPRVILIGTDAPGLDAAVLHSAAAALASHDAVFVPALDGGYVLVGLRKLLPTLFEGMTWSVPTVMQETRERLRRAGALSLELPALADIDVPADLVHLPQGW